MTTCIEDAHVKQVYEQIAPHFNNTRTYKWSWISEFLDSIKTNSLVYDLGCGNGRNMSHQNLHFIGVDNCEKFINICNSKQLNVLCANIICVPLKNGSADAIICIAVLHHLSNFENRLLAFQEMKRLIKPGGKILISVWSINQPTKTRRHFNNYGHNMVLWNNLGKIYERNYYIFKLEEIKVLIKYAGLLILKYKHDCGNEIFILTKIKFI